MSVKQQSVDIASEAMKATPPAAVSLAAVVGHLNTAIIIMTAIYIALQVAYLIWKWRREARKDAS